MNSLEAFILSDYAESIKRVIYICTHIYMFKFEGLHRGRLMLCVNVLLIVRDSQKVHFVDYTYQSCCSVTLGCILTFRYEL